MTENKNRVAVFIDGSNFFFKLRSLEFNFSNLTRFDYRKFSEWLAADRLIVYCGYYVGAVRAKENDEKSQRLRRQQQKLFAHLTSPEQDFVVKTGYLMETQGKYHEKGVDVQMAVDLLINAYENLCDVAVLVSSDTDLIPAIQKVKHLGKKVEYIGFSHQPSFGLKRYATFSRLVTKQELEPFTFKA